MSESCCQNCGEALAKMTELWRAERAIRQEAERRTERLKARIGAGIGKALPVSPTKRLVIESC